MAHNLQKQPGFESFIDNGFDFYFLDEQTIARIAISYIGSFPFVKKFIDVSNNEALKAILDLGFIQTVGAELFNKESKIYDGKASGYFHPTEKVFIAVFFQEEADEFTIESLGYESEATDKITNLELFYSSGVNTIFLSQVLKSLEKVALIKLQSKPKKNHINFLCFDNCYRLKNVKVDRPFKMDLSLNYGDEFIKIHEHLLRFLNSDESGLAILHGVVGSGKCLGKGTPILMFDGNIKLVEDVVVGDTLMGPDSKPRRVLSTTSGNEELFRVSPVKGDSYIVNRSHILSLKMSGNRSRYKHGEIINMSVQDYLGTPLSMRGEFKTWRTGVEFKESPVPLDPYFLGLWLGNGTLGADTPGITTMEPEVVDYFKDLLPKMGMLMGHISDKNTGKASTYHFRTPERTNEELFKHRNPINMALRSLGIFDKKRIPLCYKTNSRGVRLQLLAGIVDTDTYNSNNCYEIVTVLPDFCDDILFLCRSLGFAAYVTKRTANWTAPGGYSGKVTSFRICVSGDLSVIPCRVKRRKVKPRRQIKSVLVSGIKVESVGTGEYFGFELEGDGLFLLGDFTVTHNTSYLRYLLGVLDKKVIYVPPHLINRVAEPDFLSFLLKQSDFILLIEDAEEIVTNREDTKNTAGVSNLLNLSDGILGDCIKARCIVTFNTEVKNIDPALLRKGRLKLEYQFDKLSPTQANKLLFSLGINETVNEPTSLGDLYNLKNENFRREKTAQKMGFGGFK